MSARTRTAPRRVPADRRTARAVATRAAVVDALLDLLREGQLQPTAPLVAARAGVSLRSVFQHFADREALFAAAADRQTAHVRALAQRLDRTAPLDERLAAFVAQRASMLEAIAPVRRAALLMEPFSSAIGTRLAQARGAARAELAHVFGPELRRRAAADRRELLAALAAASGFSAWDALRAHEGLPVTRARRAMLRTLRALLRQP